MRLLLTYMRCLFLWNKLLSISRISRFTGLLLKSGLPSTGAAPSVPEARDFQSWEVHEEHIWLCHDVAQNPHSITEPIYCIFYHKQVVILCELDELKHLDETIVFSVYI